MSVEVGRGAMERFDVHFVELFDPAQDVVQLALHRRHAVFGERETGQLGDTTDGVLVHGHGAVHYGMGFERPC